MADRSDRRTDDRSTPEERSQRQVIPADAAEGRKREVRLYNVAPEDMPPAAAGANAEIGGEAAASRRVAGLPDDLAREPEHRAGEATPGREPVLGYDGLDTDDALDWILKADPEAEELRRIYDYERTHRKRDAVLHDVKERLRRFGMRPEREE